MLFYTFNLVISAEKSNMKKEKKSIITFTIFQKNIFFFLSFFETEETATIDEETKSNQGRK